MGLAVHSVGDAFTGFGPSAIGELVLRIGQSGCELVSFTPRSHGSEVH